MNDLNITQIAVDEITPTFTELAIAIIDNMMITISTIVFPAIFDVVGPSKITILIILLSIMMTYFLKTNFKYRGRNKKILKL